METGCNSKLGPSATPPASPPADERARARASSCNNGTVGFHNFNLRLFNLSLKSEQINCGCFFDTMSDFNVPGSRPNKNTMKFRTSTVNILIVIAVVMIRTSNNEHSNSNIITHNGCRINML